MSERTEEQGRGNRMPDDGDPSARQTGSARQGYIIVVNNEQVEDEEEDDNKFQDRSTRMLFVRKVLGTVGLQLLICTCLMLICYVIAPIRAFFYSVVGGILCMICFFIWMGLSIGIHCCRLGYGKPNPTNISLCLLTTLLLSVYATGVVVQFHVEEIMIAAAATVGTVFILTLITFFTKLDITGYAFYILGAVLAIFLFGIFTYILMLTGVIPNTFENRRIIGLVFGCLSVMILAVMIVYHLQLIVGKGRYKYTEHDWLRASLGLFSDIVFFFLEMLGIARGARG